MTRTRDPLTPLIAVVAGLAAVLWVLLQVVGYDRDGLDDLSSPVLLALLAAGFLLTDNVQVQVELRRQSLLLSLSEIPLVLGLFLVPAPGVLAASLLATLLTSAWRRTAPAKVAFNAATVTAEVATVYLVFAALGGSPPVTPAGPASWVAAYAGLLAGTLLCGGLVALAICRLQGRVTREDLLLMAAPLLLSALLNTTLALVILLVLQADVRAGLLVAVLLGAGGFAYRAYSRLLRRHRSLAQLQHLSAAWACAESVREVGEALLRHGRDLLNAGHVEVHLTGPAAVLQLTLAEDGTDPVEAPSEIGADIVARVLSRGTTLHRMRPLRDRRGSGSGRWGLRDAICVPLRSQGESLGVLLFANRLGDTSTFDQADVELAELVASQVAVALHNGRLIDRLRHEATHDALTALPNRAAFQDAMAAALARQRPFAVLLMDLDGFKEVNDTLGHQHGDELLRSVAGRLQAQLPADMVVARLGGDEFAVLAPLSSNGSTADGGLPDGGLPDGGLPDGEATAALLHRALVAPFVVDGVHLDVRASVGVSISPDDGLDGPTLLKRADIAMYEAKTIGVPVRNYDAGADRSSHRRLALVAELRGAIDRNELVCHYQPKLDLRTGRVEGAEALVRWQHPEYGLVFPDDFIPIAEQTGLIVPLTMRVLQQALYQSGRWQSWGLPMNVAVNVSPRGLLATGFADGVLRVLAESGVPPERLTLEITESSVMAEPGQAIRVLHELHAAGVRLSVDDFGTGYSSLAYLQRLPVHEVKIDKSFVRDLDPGDDRAAIVRAVVDLGHILGLQVVAEGVENAAVADLLLHLGCDLVQGYFYSRPVAADAFWSWCAERRSDRTGDVPASPRPVRGVAPIRPGPTALPWTG